MTNLSELLAEKGSIAYTTKGRSMLPLLRQGRDVIIVKNQRQGFKKNDAVLYLSDNGEYILHRIRKLLPDSVYFIIGDNCFTGEAVSEDQILGILAQIRRGKKTFTVNNLLYRLYVLFVPTRRFFLKVFYYSKNLFYSIYRKCRRSVRLLFRKRRR